MSSPSDGDTTTTTTTHRVCDGLQSNNPLGVVHHLARFVEAAHCQLIVDGANTHGQWETTRHKNYPTTDIPVCKLPNRARSVVENVVVPNIVAAMRRAYDLTDADVDRIRPFDLFVVKYNPEGQALLRHHRDVSELSFVVTLSEATQFDGGGTHYYHTDQTIRGDCGDVVMHCGKVKHGGSPVTRGVRYILIGFMEVRSPHMRLPDKALTDAFADDDKRHLDWLWRRLPHDDGDHPRHIPIRIINLPERSERLRRVMDDVRRLDVPSGWTVDVATIVADRGRSGGTAYANWAVKDSSNKYWRRDVTRGEMGCFTSHVQTLRTQAPTADHVLILEDDVVLPSDLLYRIAQCLHELDAAGTEWDWLDFGGKSVRNPDPSSGGVTPSLVRRGYAYNTQCILHSSAGLARFRAATNLTRNIIAYDEFLSVLRGCHPRIEELAPLYDWGRSDGPNARGYFSHDVLCRQRGDGVSDTSVDSETCSEGGGTTALIRPCKREDSFDLVNYYVFKDSTVRNAEDARTLITRANAAMWQFVLTLVQQRHGEATVSDDDAWYVPLATDATRKITLVVLDDATAHIEMLRHNTMRRIQGGDPSIIVCIPSYIPIRGTTAKWTVWYAHGPAFV